MDGHVDARLDDRSRGLGGTHRPHAQRVGPVARPEDGRAEQVQKRPPPRREDHRVAFVVLVDAGEDVVGHRRDLASVGREQLPLLGQRQIAALPDVQLGLQLVGELD